MNNTETQEKISMRSNKIAIAATLAMLIVLAGSVTASARMAPPGNQYDRQAMVAEANYALNGPYYGPAWIGQWNYMASDPASQAKVIVRMGGASNAGWTANGIITGHPEYGYIDDKGRGGQCLFFVNLLLHRSDSDISDDQNYWGELENSKTSIDVARAGDVVFKPRPGPHVAVVYYRSGNYITLAESNYRQPEIMSIRSTTISSLRDQGYEVYTGVDYYYT